MGAENSDQGQEWLAVIGRSLAFLCLGQADLRDKGLVPQVKLLEALGLSRKEAAQLLNTTDKSLSELLRRSKGTRNAQAKRKKAR
jgi:hypothetical protein